MSVTPLESAARALWKLSGASSKPDDAISDVATPEAEDWKRFLPEARAVVEAIREPNEEMTQAGAVIVRNVHAEESEVAFASDAANTWRFMIDAALSAG